MLYDLFIIGGGINGTAIALDAAGRDLSVILCETSDLASGTSSASTKLIHGGLRYLEQKQFCYVRESLRERSILMNKAPHLIHPMRFIIPYSESMRPAWLIRCGLFLYDHLGGRSAFAKSTTVNLRQNAAGESLQQRYQKGFCYTDCWTDDSRLVVLNAMRAQELGATIKTRTTVVAAVRNADHWLITLHNRNDNTTSQIKSKALINAAGPWVDTVLNEQLHLSDIAHIVLVKGSHVIVPRIGNHSEALVFQHTDKRIIFLIPYLDQFTLIGTTDESFEGDPRIVKISQHEIHYLCEAVNAFLQTAIKPTDIINSYSGVRALTRSQNKNLSALPRDYHLQIDSVDGKLPLLSVFGGKLTTHRLLAEDVLAKLKPFFDPMKPNWTQNGILPGGDIPHRDYEKFIIDIVRQYSELDPELIKRYGRTYGTRIHTLLKNISTTKQLGNHYGASLYDAEVLYLQRFELAQTAEDILWRRTKLGYFYPRESINELNSTIKKLISQSSI